MEQEPDIEEIIKKLEVKKVLIVDDTKDHIDAAKKAFSDYRGIMFDYASSEQEAKEKITAEYEKGEKYDYIITDMVMETEVSGKEIIKYAEKKHTLGSILTRTFHGAVEEEQTGHKVQLQSFSAHITPLYLDLFMQSKKEPELWKKALTWGLFRYSGTGLGRDYWAMYKEKFEKQKQIE